MSKRLEGRVALVTGASRGIGRAVARRFAEEGATVVAVSRTQGALEELDDEVRGFGGQMVLVPEDLRDSEKIDHIAAALYQRFGKLDILVGNAAVLGTLSPMSHTKPEDFADVMNTNLSVNWQLIRYMEPLLRQSDAGRAIFVTSSVAREPRAYWSAYAVSKAALDCMVRTWAEELRNTPIRANLYDPGRTATRMRAIAYPGENQDALPTADSHADAFVDLAVPGCDRQGEIVIATKG